MGKVVGIDLGTTFSAIAYIDDNGVPQLIENSEGDRTTPSTVLFGNKTVVGKNAKKKSMSAPGNYEAFVKRHMGEKSYVFTTQNGESYHAEEISALVLKKLKEDAEKKLGEEISGAVITVPAYFGDPQLQATKHAAELAQIKVLDMINEPTAAAIAFGVSKDIEKRQKIMIYDFGGGTFDVSILDIDQNEITVIATNGNHKLGGYDIDLAIFNYVVNMAMDEDIDIKSDKKACQNLMIQAEEAKKELSSNDSAEICIYVRGEEFSIEIDRETFEDEIADTVLNETMSIMQRALDEAELDYEDIDKILLVGGSSRIPAIYQMIEDDTGITPSSEVHPDEAVAIGAAYHAVEVAARAVNSKDEDTPAEDVSVDDSGNVNTTKKGLSLENVDIPQVRKNYSFRDVTSHGIGILIFDPITEGMVNKVLMPKNTEVPAKIEQSGFTTVEPFQSEIQITVTQGEFEDVNATTIIGQAVLNIRPRESLVPIMFFVSCDENAMIHVEAYDMDDNVNLGEIPIDRSLNNLTEKEMQQAQEHMRKLDIG